MRAYFEEAKRVGTPRPEILALQAHQLDVVRSFMYTWEKIFNGGIVEFHLKELLRLRISLSSGCHY